jgi:hypothetical protein
MSPNVVAIGGTNLSADGSGNYQGESAWSYGGGGYSSYEGEPGFQRSVQSSGRRTGPDVAYNAGTGVYVAWTPPSTGKQNWYSATGTSAGAPQWSGIIAIADQIRVAAGEHTLDGPSQTLYALYNSAMTGDYHDITSGSNGYAARPGYDLATGRGTPYASRVILDLARVSDGFHGAVAASAGASPAGAASVAVSTLSEGAAAAGPGGGAEGVTAVVSGSGGATVATLALTAGDSGSAEGTAGADLAVVSADGRHPTPTDLALAPGRTADTDPELQAWDAVFAEGSWM